MSTPVITNTNVQIDNVQIDNVQIEKVKSTRPPSLAGKYSKFLLFGFQFIEQLKTHNLLSDVEASYQLLSLFSNVEDQTEYFENFFLNIKSSTKEMKLVLKNKLNANKPIKAKKGKSTIPNATDTNDVILTDAVASEKKRGRKKKDNTVVHDKQDQIVIDLLAAANNPDPIIPSSIILTATETTTTETTTTAPAPKYKRDKSIKNAAIDATKEHIQTINASIVNQDKPKPKRKLVVKPTTPILSTIPLPVIEPILPVIEPTLPVIEPTLPVIEKKPKTKTEKKPDVPLPIQAELVQEPLTIAVAVALAPTNLQLILPADNDKEEDEEITTETFIHEGIQYLKDDNHTVYDKDTFDVVGKYNKNTNTINPLGFKH